MTSKNTASKYSYRLELPAKGFMRASALLPHLCFGRSTLWAWSKDGKRFPAPIKIGSMTCWRLEDVHAWMDAQGKTSPEAANDAGDQ